MYPCGVYMTLPVQIVGVKLVITPYKGCTHLYCNVIFSKRPTNPEL